MTEPPRSQQFDDVYFSADDGLAETYHVFVEGNSLPSRWQDRAHYTIAETGFGTGLNFLAAWKLFMETAPPGAFLDFISVEKYPLSPAEIRKALDHWAADLAPYLEKMLNHYPLRTAGYHRMVFEGRVALTLIFDDVNDAFPALDAQVDSWFLDGFTPAKNPGMWSDTLFTQMARLSAPCASFATFTAAGDVKRGLRAAGFDVEKRRGFGRKRDMLAGHFTGEAVMPRRAYKEGGRIGIIGGGLAGTATAYVLKQYGFTPVIYEKAHTLAPGASGNKLGLYNPRFTALRGPESDFYAPAFARARRTLGTFKDINFNPCGALHLLTDDDKRTRLTRMKENWGWHDDHASILDSTQASAIAGIAIDHDALYLPDSGYVSPAALCKAYAQDVEVHLHADVHPDTLNEETIVLAGGADMAKMYDLPLETVRGQVTYLSSCDALARLNTALCYGGYVVGDGQGGGVTGATFQPWLENVGVRDEDNAANLDKLAAAVPALAGMKAQGGRAALRTASKDRFPVIGNMAPGRYISTAHGSHGILSSLMGAHLLADMIRGGPVCLPCHTVKALEPGRFARRARKTG